MNIRASHGFKMISRNEQVCMELAFIRENNVNRQEKIKAFWRFLDAQNDLQSHKATPEEEPSAQIKSPVLRGKEISDEKDIWRKGLEILQRLGLDKTALAADNRCRLCLVERTTWCKDLADAVAQPYEELNNDMKAFERKSRNTNQGETFSADNTLDRCNSKHTIKR